jgi:8-oxo-dGTP pyrophosphatase MutT (NUDIX family)
MLEKAQVWIYSKTDDVQYRVLLLKLIPERSGIWQPVTGHIEIGEALEVGAFREAFEETGLKPKTKIELLNFDFTFQGQWGLAHETAFAMEVEPGCPEPTLDPNEHTEYLWIDPHSAIKMLSHRSNQEALEKLIRRLKSA